VFVVGEPDNELVLLVFIRPDLLFSDILDPQLLLCGKIGALKYRDSSYEEAKTTMVNLFDVRLRCWSRMSAGHRRIVSFLAGVICDSASRSRRRLRLAARAPRLVCASSIG
jgi:hypothetical protein